MKENSTKKLWDDTNTNQQLNARETEQFLSKLWQPREHYTKAEWIINMVKDLERLEDGPKAEMLKELMRMALKKYLIEKYQAMIECMDSGPRNSPPFMTE